MLAVAGLFFPLTKLLGIAPDSSLSPGVLLKVVHAGAHATSFRQAAQSLAAVGEVTISSQRVRRACEAFGAERVEQAEAAAADYQQLSLPARQQAPRELALTPEVVCVQVDGGRIQIRPRGQGAQASGYWRETKVGCLQTLRSEVQVADPCPELPAIFAKRANMAKMGREIHGFSDVAIEAEHGAPPECSAVECHERAAVDDATVVVGALTTGAPTPREKHPARAQRPVPLVRSVVATRGDLEQFGARLVAAAHARGFAAAPRKAFVADGAAANWSVWKQHFSHYTPILDWIHALTYIHAAALGGMSRDDAWPTYLRWAQAIWSGNVALVIEELQRRQTELGQPTADDAAHAPRQVIADALRYLSNQQSRMRYDEYRRLGLPITSSAIESTIKQVNRRVKGSEKFWSGGAEAMLQLVADHLSETHELANYWRQRHQTIPAHRCYQAAA